MPVNSSVLAFLGILAGARLALTAAALASTEEGADMIANAMRARVPRKSGKLAASIRVTKAGKRVRISAGGAPTFKEGHGSIETNAPGGARTGGFDIGGGRFDLGGRDTVASFFGGREGDPRKAGGGRGYDYAMATEFGTRHEPAHPFFWPTYRSMKAQVQRKIVADLKRAASQSLGTF